MKKYLILGVVVVGLAAASLYLVNTNTVDKSECATQTEKSCCTTSCDTEK